ncbi:MAG: ATP-grasp domain-containing protein [Lachnospiraceae bacterium]|nr:ATP-grasp domain-containing protein [Lachnospiraceae bacterium]
MKKKIVVAEAMSSAFYYIDDIRERGYEPVILETFLPEGYVKTILDKERKDKYARIKGPIQIIREDPDYNVTLDKIKALDPLLVIPGSEDGVVIGTRLANDLGLISNPYSNIDRMTKKNVMHQGLREAGLRYIRGEEVSTWEECLAFLEKIGSENVVLKHAHGSGSVGVHLIHRSDELKAAYEQECGTENTMFNGEKQLMIQERIFGTEYIVNTISRDGIPAITSMFKYYKKETDSGDIIYLGSESIGYPNEEEKVLIDYALQTVRALGIMNGPVHGEYMIDENGPVLIEINCRVMGSSAPSGWLDLIFGYHETGVVLDCLLDRDFHEGFRKKPYKPLRKGYVKDFYVAKDQSILSSGIVPIVLNLRSYYSGWVDNAGRTDCLQKTVDLETETGLINMVHDDPNVVSKEFEALIYIEEHYPELFQSNASIFHFPENEQEVTPGIRAVMEKDIEVLISEIIAYYRNGEQGEPPVPDELLKVSLHNRVILALLEGISL